MEAWISFFFIFYGVLHLHEETSKVEMSLFSMVESKEDFFSTRLVGNHLRRHFLS